tara:strand:- start:657 stop:2408 length:1752 start_codon:yes stop_codon:yes gene_type:complete
MGSIYAVDYETYYDDQVSVTTLGPWNYVCNEHYSAYMVSIVGDDGLEYVGPPEDAPWDNIIDGTWLSHNALFDQTVHDQLGLSRPAGPWYCTADLTAYCGVKRGLDTAAKHLLGIEVSKAVRTKMKGKTWVDAINSGMAQDLKEYAIDDSRHCLALWQGYQEFWPDHERALSQHTRDIANRGICINKARLARYRIDLSKAREKILDDIPWVGEGRDEDTPLSTNKLRAYLAEKGIPCPPSVSPIAESYLTWAKKYPKHTKPVELMTQYRRVNRLLKQLNTLREFVRPNGTVGTPLKYFGAHTGRWSGGGGFNFQNIPGSELAGVELRRLFVPSKGRRLLSVDLSQIEARVLAWVAGDFPFLDLVATGQSPYEAHARASLGWTGGPLKKEDPQLYKLAKARVLGLGYGCGHLKFVELAKMMLGRAITPEEAQLIVNDYRRSNPLIVAFWYNLDGDLKRHIHRHPGEPYELELPSGRVLEYHDLTRDDKGVRGVTVLGMPAVYLYGGKLAENVVQAIARDVMGANLLRLEEAGHQILLHIHDEAIIEVDADFDTSEVESIMAHTPSWLEGCPLDAEAVKHTYLAK